MLCGCHRALVVVVAVSAWWGAAHAAVAENWPHWRGPQQNGVSTEKDLPSEWGPQKNVAWRLPMPGYAGSTPVVWGERIFLTTANGSDLELMCISTEGQLEWRQRISGDGQVGVRRDEGNYASPSPTTDGELVCVLMGNGQLACFTVDGQPKWAMNVEDRYGELNIQFSLTSTPVLDRGRLYLQILHGEGDPATHESRVICLNADTGDEVWSQERVTGARAECEHSYSSPVLYRHGDLEFLLSHGADFTIAHDLDDGSEIWRCGGMNPPGRYHPTLRFIASPGISENLIVIPTAKNGPVLAVRPDGRGDITGTDKVVWRMERNTPDVPSPLVHDGLVYLYRETGNLMCIDGQSGQTHYNERTPGGRNRSSPVYADGKIYVTNREGEITVVKAGPEFERIAVNDMGEVMTSSPAISDGTIYLRTYDALYAIREE